MYKNYVFDFYGTLVDIRTDEEKKEIWETLSLFYGYYGAVYTSEEMKEKYKKLTECRTEVLYSHEVYPEIQLETVFQELFAAKGVAADDNLTLHAGQFFRALTTEYIRLYEGVPEMLERIKRKGKKVYLLT